MHFSSLEDTISPDNQVRFIDAFVEYIDLSKLDFAVKTLKTEGRPSFNSKVFLKMYLWSVNILGVPDLIAKLKKWNSPYKAKVLFLLKTMYLKLITPYNFYSMKFTT